VLLIPYKTCPVPERKENLGAVRSEALLSNPITNTIWHTAGRNVRRGKVEDRPCKEPVGQVYKEGEGRPHNAEEEN
jgi:hypothetical protein